jgi:hypothetical protein
MQRSSAQLTDATSEILWSFSAKTLGVTSGVRGHVPRPPFGWRHIVQNSWFYSAIKIDCQGSAIA